LRFFANGETSFVEIKIIEQLFEVRAKFEIFKKKRYENNLHKKRNFCGKIVFEKIKKIIKIMAI
jgi:hypothetical protein